MNIKHLLFFLLIGLILNTYSSTARQIIDQKIIYHAPFAKEVYLVWGIDNWQPPDLNLQPKGTMIKDKLIYTPMINGKEGFYNTLKVPLGCKVDFIFYITKGPFNTELNRWDINHGSLQENYYTIAHDNVISYISANVPAIIAPDKFSFLVFGKDIFLILMLLSGIIFLTVKIPFKKYLFKIPSIANEGLSAAEKLLKKPWLAGVNPYLLLLAVVVVLFIQSLFIRATITGTFGLFLLSPWSAISKIFIDVYYDYLVLLSAFIVFFGLIYLFDKNKKIKRWLLISFLLFAIVFLITGLLNIKMIEYLGSPFNYRWLYYSDFLRTTDSKNAISGSFDYEYFFNGLYIIFSTIILSLLVYKGLAWLIRKIRQEYMFISFSSILSVYLIVGYYFIPQQTKYNKTANPVYFFLNSLNPFADDVLALKDEASANYTVKKFPVNKDWQAKFDKAKIENVLIYVLESTPAEYIGVYDNYQWDVTPTIDSIADYSVIVENAYACTPSTNKSLVSLLCSMYPWLSYLGLTSEHPEINFPSLPSLLKKEGYRTAFFNSGDNDFKSTKDFLKHRSLDVISDFRDNNCSKQFKYNNDCKGCDGSSDYCLGESFFNWIDHHKDQSPFFATLWTYQTHYPYFINGNEKYYTQNKDFNRYLNALRDVDGALQSIVNGLKQRNLLENTLIVIIGDHGEAFGRHGQLTHASNIYEENLHIPLIFYNEKLFKGEKFNMLTGMPDVAPTICAILGKKTPEEWQGNPLFTDEQNKNVYFFAPYSDYWFGIREANFKYLYNATLNEYELYELYKDPYEENNVAEEYPEVCVRLKNKLSGWVKYQDDYMKKLLKKS